MFCITKTGTRQRLRARNSKRRLGKKSELVSSHKWIFDAHPHNRPSGIQIFRQDPTGATLESRRDDESIPESDSVFILDSTCSRDFGECGIDAPDNIAAYYQTRRLSGYWVRNLAGDVSRRIPEALGCSGRHCVQP